MLISYNWLKEFIPDLACSPEEVAEQLTTHSFETKVTRQVKIDPKILVAKVIKIEAHPRADRLRLVTVDTGKEEVTVVCGAKNVQEGMLAPFSPVGTTLLDETGKPFQLTMAKIRGVESPGMLNSPRELGLGDWHGGIYSLPEEVAIGTPLCSYIIDDVILEADVTPNRAHDCLCHVGIARELAAVLNLAVREVEAVSLADTGKMPDWDIAVENNSDCPRYISGLVANVSVRPAPLWLQARMWAMGGRPINNVVDITNYVMFEMGNPTHAFDAQKLAGQNIVVRRGKTSEALTSLDDVEYKVSPDDLLITSGNKPVALAGIIGGREAEVADETKEVLLEAANFRSYLVQQTGSRLKIDTESASRFRKDLDPSVAKAAFGRLVQLLEDLAGAKLLGATDVYVRQRERKPVEFKPQEVARIAGLKLDDKEALDILKRLRCRVEEKGEEWNVWPPEERLDISGSHDLVEEVIRLVGLEKITSRQPAVAKTPIVLPDLAQWREIVRGRLCESGMVEMLNISFADEKIMRLLVGTVQPMDRIRIINPPTPDKAYLRRLIWPSLVANILTNKAELVKKLSSSPRAFFEIGQVFLPGTGGEVEGVKEEEHVAGIWLGDRALAQAREMIEQIVRLLGTTNDGFRFGQAQELPSASSIVQKLKQPIAFFELNLNQLALSAELAPEFSLNIDQEIRRYVAPSRYPAVYRDVSILVEKGLSADTAQEIIERAGGELVADVDLFDTYEPAGADKQGLAWHITYQSREKTLTDEEVDSLHNNIIAKLKSELDAVIRD